MFNFTYTGSSAQQQGPPVVLEVRISLGRVLGHPESLKCHGEIAVVPENRLLLAAGEERKTFLS